MIIRVISFIWTISGSKLTPGLEMIRKLYVKNAASKNGSLKMVSALLLSKARSALWYKLYHITVTVMLVAAFFWWRGGAPQILTQNVMLVTSSWSWWCYLSPTSQTSRQHILFSTSVTNIDQNLIIEHSEKDNSIKDFYDDWSIEKTCDTVTLESRHPMKPPHFDSYSQMFYTHECEDDKIAYFKVDVNLIGSLPNAYLGNVW